MATNFTYRFYTSTGAALSPDSVVLIRSDKVWATGIAMTWNSTTKAYEAVIDLDDAAKYNATLRYKIRHNDATDILTDLMIGDGRMTADLTTHIADTTTHGVTTAIVGVDDAQTLTNKTIDQDAAGNHLHNIHPDDIKAGSIALPQKTPVFAPRANATDAVIRMVNASATAADIQCIKADGSTDAKLDLVGSEIHVALGSGAAAKITGVSPGTVNGDAADYSQIATLTAAVAALSTADAFSGSPVCSAAVTGYDLGHGEAIGLRLQWGMESDAQTAKAKRWEVFWTPGVMPVTVAVGAISAANLAALRTTAGIFRRDIQKGQPLVSFFDLRPGQYSFQVVAFDWSTGQYASASQTNSAIIGGALRPSGFTQTDDATYLYIPQQIACGKTIPATASNGDAKPAYAEWLSSSIAPAIKDGFAFKYKADMARLRIGYFAKTASGFAVPRFYICNNAGTEFATASGYVTATSFTQGEVQIDLSGLVAETIYELRIAFAAGGNYNAYLRGDWTAEVDRVLRTLR